jgi:hypothetical protein
MTRASVELIVAVVVALVLGVLISLGANHYMTLRSKAAQSELQGDKIEATDGIIKDGEAVDRAQQRVEIAITDGRARYTEGYEREKANDPEFARRASAPVDQRVRDAARERRLARERSARDDARSGARVAEKELEQR